MFFLEVLNSLLSDGCVFTIEDSFLPFLCTLRFYRDNGVHSGGWKVLQEIPFFDLFFPSRNARFREISISFYSWCVQFKAYHA
jgi:hypothetical protein